MDSFTLDHPAPTVLTVLKYGTQKVPICTRVIVAHLKPHTKMASVFLALLKSLDFPTYAKIACRRRYSESQEPNAFSSSVRDLMRCSYHFVQTTRLAERDFA